MKIILASINAGAGHHAARDCIYDYLQPFKQFNIKKFDSQNKSIAAIYNAQINYFQPSQNLTYEIGELEPLSMIAVESSIDIYLECLALLEAEKPDVVISHHPIPSALFAKARNKLKAYTRIISVYPDYGVPHSMYYPKLKRNQPDQLWTISPEGYKSSLKILKVPKSKLARIGIPPTKEFIAVSDKKASNAAWRKILISKLPYSSTGSIRPDVYTILFTAGGSWIKQLEDLFDFMNDNFDEDWPEFQLIIVCGKYKKMHQKLYKLIQEKKNKFPFMAFGFINRAEMANVLMASDLVVAGSLGSGFLREYIYTRRCPFLIYDHLGAQEAETVNIAVKRGIAKYIPDAPSMTREIMAFISGQRKEYIGAVRKKNENFRKNDIKTAKQIPKLLNNLRKSL